MSLIETIISNYQHRGLEPLLQIMPTDYCTIAAEAIMELPGKTILICTGFYSYGFGETDGPIGSFFLYAALKKLGFEPVIITDSYNEVFFKQYQLNYELYNHTTYAKNILNKYQPSAIIAVERCGRAADGTYYSMKGKNISAFVSSMDDLFIQANCLTIGIGDGGNEIGMGKYYEELSATIPLIRSIIQTDYLITATVSNWGAYGLLAALSCITKINVLPSFMEVEEYLKFIVENGATDGFLGAKHLSVDGFDLSVEKEIIELLKNVIETNG